MDWLSDNWVWLLLIGAFLGMHLFGHRHGGHGSGGCCGGKAKQGQAVGNEAGRLPSD